MRTRILFKWFLVVIASFTLSGNLIYDILHTENIFHSSKANLELIEKSEFTNDHDVEPNSNRKDNDNQTGRDHSHDEIIRFLNERNSTNAVEMIAKDELSIQSNRLTDVIVTNGSGTYSSTNSTGTWSTDLKSGKENPTNTSLQPTADKGWLTTGGDGGDDILSKSQKIVNPHPFRYIINTRLLCDNDGDDVFLLIYVHTAVDHHKRRNIIRQTWGDVKQYNVSVRLVFFLGSPPNISSKESRTEAQNLLHFEADQYGDIVQEDFLDTYHNLTYKGVAALKWIVNSCQRAKFVLKTDDDIFVNMFTLIRHLSRLRDEENVTTNTIVCMVYYNMLVMRTGKWKVSFCFYTLTIIN